MTKLAFLLALIPTVALADNHLMGDKQTVAYDCSKDAVTSIMGNNNTIALSGDCTTVSISGNHNTLATATAKTVNISGDDNKIDVSTATTINVSGNKNALVWHKSGPKDSGPKLNVTGKDNQISSK